MAIRFEQPSPVGAAGEVGRLQGAAAASNNAQRNQLAAANLYAEQAARMAAIQQQGAGQWTQANIAFAGLDERAHEAGLDFENQRAIGQERMAALQMQEQAAAQRQQQMIQARLREQAIAEGELTPAEDQQLVRYESGLAEVKKAMAEGRLTQAQAAPLMDRLMGQVSSLRLRKQLTGEQKQQMEMAAFEDRQKFMTVLWGNDQAAKTEFMKRHTIEQRLPDGNVRYGLLLPDGKVDWYEAPQPKEQKPAITPQMASAEYKNAEAEVTHRHPEATGSERQRLIDEEYTRRLGKLQAIAGGASPGGGVGGGESGPPINLNDQAELAKAEIADNPAIPQEIKVAAANAIDDAKRLLEPVGWDVSKLSKADREKYDRLKNFVNSLPQAPRQQPAQPPPPETPRQAGPGEAVPGLSTGFGPADFIRRQIGG